MGSVWNEEVDTALLKLIKKITKYHDSDGNLQTPNVIIRNPQGEFQIKSFPTVSITNYDQEFDYKRYDDSPTVVRDMETGIAKLEESALPYNLYYQIDFWADYHTDMNEMTRRWVGNIKPKTTLELKDAKGKTRYSVMNLKDFAVVDELEDNEKILHRVYSYVIWVELDEDYDNSIEKYMVTQQLEIEEVEYDRDKK